MSHSVLTYHLIIGTYRRHYTIDQAHERELYKFLFDFAGSHGAYVRRIGGMPDHVHILCDISPKIAISDFVRVLKAESSKFLKANNHFPNWNRWADGYGIFAVDASSRETRRQYIMNQREHHQKLSFEEEYRLFLQEADYPDDTPILTE